MPRACRRAEPPSGTGDDPERHASARFVDDAQHAAARGENRVAALAFAVLADLDVLPRLRIGGVDFLGIRTAARILPGAPGHAVLVEGERGMTLRPGPHIMDGRLRREFSPDAERPLHVP